MSDAATNADLTVYYDGDCPICSREVAHYRGLDAAGRIAWRDIAAEPSASDEAGVSCEAAMARMHAMTAEGDVVSGARAFIEIWRRTPGWGWAARLLSVPPILWIAEQGYSVFAPRRQAISRFAAKFFRWKEA